MGNAGNKSTDRIDFEAGIKYGDYSLVSAAARRLGSLDLLPALQLTILAAQHAPRDRFDAMAVRWLARLAGEKRIDLNDLHWAAARLQQAREGLPRDARGALEALLSERRRRMAPD